jgi:hypothetical protein
VPAILIPDHGDGVYVQNVGTNSGWNSIVGIATHFWAG